MPFISRQISHAILSDCFKGKIIILLGARQVGKSTLIRHLPFDESIKVLWLDAENADVRTLLTNTNSERIRQLAGEHKVIVVDEAQKIENIGSVLKLFADFHSDIQVIASGSSSFELRNTLNEPLTGRKFEYILFPLSFREMAQQTDLLTELRKLPLRLVYGYYPEVVQNETDAERLLRFLAESYLYKDIFIFRGIKKPEKMLELLRLLAWQIGSEVNFNELGRSLALDNATVESYLSMLELAFVVYRLPAYHTNQRNELKKAKKIYFNDLGIRNALINDFRPIELRSDAGALFENFAINEFRKQNEYDQAYGNFYFWRSTEQQEVDLVIEKNGHLFSFEFKWNPAAKVKLPKTFSNKYPQSSFYVIHRENFFEVLNGNFKKLLSSKNE